jgi:hypothetical protein
LELRLKYLLAIILIYSSLTHLSSQNLIYIPDDSLRKELGKQGFLFQDSLSPAMASTVNRLELEGKGITNLYGLQFFINVKTLFLDRNQIRQLDYLPPFLSILSCSNNQIARIDSLPCCLTHLGVSNNKINYVCKLPASLETLFIYNNALEYFPKLPSNLTYINYAKNPIPNDSIPNNYKQIACKDESQNCLPYSLRPWNILNAEGIVSFDKIIGVEIIQTTSRSWSYGTQTETTNFKVVNGQLIANKTEQIVYTKKKKAKRKIAYKYSLNKWELDTILNHISKRMMNFEVTMNDSLFFIDLTRKMDGTPCISLCADCPSYSFNFNIYTETDTFKMVYGFYSTPTLCKPLENRPENLLEISNFLYCYQLVSKFIPKNKIVERYFDINNLRRYIRWSEL